MVNDKVSSVEREKHRRKRGESKGIGMLFKKAKLGKQNLIKL